MNVSYNLSRSLDLGLNMPISRVIAARKDKGFGILTDIDVQATLKAKIGADMPKYRVLAACNPRFAHQALQIEDKLGVLVPCNVIVRETADGKVEVAAIDPVSSMEHKGNTQLQGVARDVRPHLQRAVEKV